MSKVDSLLLSLNSLQYCDSPIDHKNNQNTRYSRAYNRVIRSVATALDGKTVDQDTVVEVREIYDIDQIISLIDPGSTIKPTRLDKYFFSKLSISNGSIRGLTPQQVQAYGLVMERSWQVNFVKEGDTSRENHDQEMVNAIDAIILRNYGEITLYNPTLPSVVTYYTHRYTPGEWSSKDLLPIGLLIERPALNYLVYNGIDDVLEDVEGNIVVTR